MFFFIFFIRFLKFILFFFIYFLFSKNMSCDFKFLNIVLFFLKRIEIFFVRCILNILDVLLEFWMYVGMLGIISLLLLVNFRCENILFIILL